MAVAQRDRVSDALAWIVVTGQRLYRDRAVRQALVIVVGLRLALGVVAWATQVLDPPTISGGDWIQLQISRSDPLWPLIFPWQRWDDVWYLHIAMSWYTDIPSTRFFPVYPGLVRIAGLVLGGQQSQYALSQLLVNTVALFFALVWLHKLVARDVDVGTADRSILYIAVSPLAVFFFTGYSEAVFLALTIGALLAARRRRWALCAIAATGAAISRPPGILILVPVAIEIGIDAWARHRRGLFPIRSWYVAVLALPVIALGAWYLNYIAPHGGFVAIEGGLAGRAVSPPWTSLHHSLIVVMSGAHPEEVANLAFSLLLLVTIPFMAWRLPWSYTSYAVGSIFFVMCRYAVATPLASAGRLVEVVFPVFIVLAVAGRRVGIDRIITVMFPVLLCFETISFVRFTFVG